MDASRDQLDRVDRARLVESGEARDDSLGWNLGRTKQRDAIRVDSTSSRCRRQVCDCWSIASLGGMERIGNWSSRAGDARVENRKFVMLDIETNDNIDDEKMWTSRDISDSTT